MSLSIVTNIGSLTAQSRLAVSARELQTSIERLSSGLRITKAADDAAGLGLSEKLKAQIRGVVQASRNANDGISFTQMAEGAMNAIQTMLARMRELAIAAANNTLGADERELVQLEFVQLKSEIDRIANTSEYNSRMLLLSGATGLTMQVGIHNTSNDRLSVVIDRTTASTLHLSAAVTVSMVSTAQRAIGTLDDAIATVSSSRAKIGAAQNRLMITIENLAVANENFTAANSRVRDADMAAETAAYTRNQILQQAGVSVLAQANQLPSAVLSLLG